MAKRNLRVVNLTHDEEQNRVAIIDFTKFYQPVSVLIVSSVPLVTAVAILVIIRSTSAGGHRSSLEESMGLNGTFAWVSNAWYPDGIDLPSVDVISLYKSRFKSSD